MSLWYLYRSLEGIDMFSLLIFVFPEPNYSRCLKVLNSQSFDSKKMIRVRSVWSKWLCFCIVFLVTGYLLSWLQGTWPSLHEVSSFKFTLHHSSIQEAGAVCKGNTDKHYFSQIFHLLSLQYYHRSIELSLIFVLFQSSYECLCLHAHDIKQACIYQSLKVIFYLCLH